MTLSFLQSFLDWISQNAIWSGFIIFVIACSESLALVGLLVPGAILMFALGTLITTGHLDFWHAVSWAVAGAIVGDGLSYWLGYYFEGRLVRLWPLSHHPQLLNKGRNFFDKHGGKSVLFGRFIGPLRPIVPAIAGMTGMPLTRFFVINILSGIAWAPLYLLPGMAFGLSLTLAGEVAGRLVIAILLVLVSILILLWLGKRLYQLMLPRLDGILFQITHWSHRHPLAGHIPDALIQPGHPEVRILSLLALLLFVAGSSYIALLQWSGQASLLAQLDKLFRFNLDILRTPWFDWVMLSISAWADIKGITLVCLITAAWLIWQRKMFTLWHLLAAFFIPLLLALGFPLLFSPSDVDLPAKPILLASSVYGFITVSLVRELSQRFHLLFYLLLTTLLFLISFASLYLQFYSLSEIAGGLSLGTIWLAVVGIAYRRHVRQAFVKTPALLGIGMAYLICLVLIMPLLSEQKPPHKPEPQVTLKLTDWQSQLWRNLPTVRNDVRFKRKHPLNLQWVGQLEAIQRQLHQLGWQTPVSAQSLNLLQWFNPKPDDKALPLLPQVHDGHYDVLRMIRFTREGPQYLRLWQTTTTIEVHGGQIPLWLGSVGSLYHQQVMGLTMLRTSLKYTAIPKTFIRELQAHHPSLRVVSKPVELNGRAIRIFLIHDE